MTQWRAKPIKIGSTGHSIGVTEQSFCSRYNISHLIFDRQTVTPHKLLFLRNKKYTCSPCIHQFIRTEKYTDESFLNGFVYSRYVGEAIDFKKRYCGTIQ
jgi:hypothetical protein